MLRIERATYPVTDDPDGQQVVWILYRDGRFDEPIATLSNMEVAMLVDQIEMKEQLADAVARRRKKEMR